MVSMAGPVAENGDTSLTGQIIDGREWSGLRPIICLELVHEPRRRHSCSQRATGQNLDGSRAGGQGRKRRAGQEKAGRAGKSG